MLSLGALDYGVRRPPIDELAIAANRFLAIHGLHREGERDANCEQCRRGIDYHSHTRLSAGLVRQWSTASLIDNLRQPFGSRTSRGNR